METPAANPVHGSYAEHAAAETPAAKYLLAIKTECCLATALKDAEARARSAVAGEVDDKGTGVRLDERDDASRGGRRVAIDGDFHVALGTKEALA